MTEFDELGYSMDGSLHSAISYASFTDLLVLVFGSHADDRAPEEFRKFPEGPPLGRLKLASEFSRPLPAAIRS
jgi:hypothetical protein